MRFERTLLRSGKLQHPRTTRLILVSQASEIPSLIRRLRLTGMELQHVVSLVRVHAARGESSRHSGRGRDVCSIRHPTRRPQRTPSATAHVRGCHFSRSSSRRACIVSNSVGRAVAVVPLGKGILERVNRLVVQECWSSASAWTLVSPSRHPEDRTSCSGGQWLPSWGHICARRAWHRACPRRLPSLAEASELGMS